MASVYLVEDDPSVMLKYEMLLSKISIDICGKANNVQKAKIDLKKINPDFAIVDIFLKDKLGFEIIKILNLRNIPVIVVTGFPKESVFERIVKLEVDSFLSKPVSEQVFKFVILKLQETLNKTESFSFYKSKSEIVKVNYNDFVFVQAERNYCVLQTTKRKYVLRTSLKSIIEDLPKESFVRIFRSILVNVQFVKSVDVSKNVLFLEDVELPIGKSYKKDLLKLIANQKNLK